LLLCLPLGCAYVPNQFREDGPSARANWDSPTAADVKARFTPAQPRQRDWPQTTAAAESGAVTHWPLYFEDPFEDKGHGRTDDSHPHDVYRGGWEDFLAVPYCFARFTGNWLMLPVSAIVTPPVAVMESDGRLSRQLLGYDHDAAPTGRFIWQPPGPPSPETAQRPPPETQPPQPEPPEEPAEAGGTEAGVRRLPLGTRLRQQFSQV
jgi:hypothetical protein